MYMKFLLILLHSIFFIPKLETHCILHVFEKKKKITSNSLIDINEAMIFHCDTACTLFLHNR